VTTETRVPALLSIGAVERETGLSKDTLRVWERRYRFPVPERDPHGERVYPAAQVEQLRALKRLIDRGHRPGTIVGRPLGDLVALMKPEEGAAASPEFDRLAALLRDHRVLELRQDLGRRLVQQGLARFLVGAAAPLTRVVGERWMCHELDVFEEHLYTEILQGVLRGAIASLPQSDRRPRIVLTTFPGEQHGLGLLMAEGMLALEGARCISLGTQTPILEIELAARRQGADVIALSFSGAYPVKHVAEGLADLRASTPPGIAIWAGGTNPGIARRPVAGVTPIPDLAAIPAAVQAWREAHAAA
jgi:DNA-binding transcriptional MerR regulator/methylmalonyl-CoA mutase cobalamin-binding subunit